MSELSNRLSNANAPLLALEATSNWHALVMLLGTMVAYVVLIGIGITTHSAAMMGIMTLIGLVTLLTGYSATGYMLMDKARELESRSFVDAILAAFFTLHRIIGVVLLSGLAFAAVLIVFALIFLVCKIPVIGPLLYAVAFPISVVVTGVFALALFYVGPTILAPSIWEGNGVVASMARLWMIVRRNLFTVVINLLLLSLVVGIITFIIGGILLAGTSTTLATSLPILGSQAGAGMMGMFNGMMHPGYGGDLGGVYGGGYGTYSGGGSGYAVAGIFGFSIVAAIAFSIPFLILISGMCHIYLQSAQGLDFEQAEAQINRGMEEAKRRAKDAQVKAQQAAQQAAERAKASAAKATATASPPPAATDQTHEATATCPNCGSAINADDVFCGNCGHHLKE